jgi:hypothetical protein
MKTMKQRTMTTFTTDTKGRRIAHVGLFGGDDRATLYADDLERILAAGWSPNWFLTSTGGRFRYVLVNALNPKGNRRSLTVARLVAEVNKGQLVKYADGDRLNLLTDNLLVRKGTAWTSLEALRPHKEVREEREVVLHQGPRGPQRYTANFRCPF